MLQLLDTVLGLRVEASMLEDLLKLLDAVFGVAVGHFVCRASLRELRTR
jgi:hypothetical protein